MGQQENGKKIPMTDIERLIKKAGIRSNTVRTYVLRCLFFYGRPLSHGEILEDPDMAGFDRVTVYRTLSKLQEAKLVHVIEGTDGIRRYCAHYPEQPNCPGNHPHFICQVCGTMVCLTGQSMPRVDVPEGMIVKGKQLVVYGICNKCAEKGNI